MPLLDLARLYNLTNFDRVGMLLLASNNVRLSHPYLKHHLDKNPLEYML